MDAVVCKTLVEEEATTVDGGTTVIVVAGTEVDKASKSTNRNRLKISSLCTAVA